MIIDCAATSIAIDEPIPETRVDYPAWIIDRAEAVVVDAGAWLAPPGDAWGIQLFPQALFSVGVKFTTTQALVRLPFDGFGMYWTTREKATAAWGKYKAFCVSGKEKAS